VEYLYSLVYQALDFISNKKRDQQPASVGVDGVDNDATFAHRSSKVEFLSLDNVSDHSKSNMDIKDQNPNLVNIVPLTPMTFVPSEEVEKKNNPLYSCRGEILASRKDFRINTCTSHTCGAFMLELAVVSPTRLLQLQRLEDVSHVAAILYAGSRRGVYRRRDQTAPLRSPCSTSPMKRPLWITVTREEGVLFRWMIPTKWTMQRWSHRSTFSGR
ncbi:condensin-2 complex subunit H2-like, partial [Ascaphus truei]|uniref:condensin-2 complex subunit H2-like n=1 Tax=Ascaphus truei TaxID=8439 RepID=UPI003F59C05E